MASVDRTIVDEAITIITGDRAEQYGNVEDNFTQIAYIWSGILGAKFGHEFDPYRLVDYPEIVSLMMVGLKLAREAFKHKRDNLRDGVGYLVLTDSVSRKVFEDVEELIDDLNAPDEVLEDHRVEPSHTSISGKHDNCNCALNKTARCGNSFARYLLSTGEYKNYVCWLDVGHEGEHSIFTSDAP